MVPTFRDSAKLASEFDADELALDEGEAPEVNREVLPV